MKKAKAIVALCAIVAVVGCGGSSGTGRARPDAIKGDWYGTWEYGSRTSGDGDLYLSIGDRSFTGTFTEYGSGTGETWGERQGDNLDGWVSSDGTTADMNVDHLTVADGHLTGKAKIATGGESVWVDFDLTMND